MMMMMMMMMMCLCVCVCTDQRASVCDGDPCGLAGSTCPMRHYEADRQRRQPGIGLLTDDRRTQSVLRTPLSTSLKLFFEKKIIFYASAELTYLRSS